MKRSSKIKKTVVVLSLIILTLGIAAVTVLPEAEPDNADNAGLLKVVVGFIDSIFKWYTSGNLKPSLAELRESFDFLCAQKGLALIWELSPTTPIIKSDPDRFKEIASNLIQNAVKYTDRGSITIRLDTLHSTDSIVLEVTDTGMGIPATAIKTIFEPFIQVHKTSSTNARGGIGLGLSIVKKHAEQLNGTISVLSDLGKGSTFRVSLPRVYRDKVARYRKWLRALKLTGNSAPSATTGRRDTTQIQTVARRIGGESRVS